MSIGQNEREQASFRSYRKFQTDYDSYMATSKDNGIAEGIQIVAKNLLSVGDSIEKIIKVTDLTLEEVEHLRT